MQYADLKKHTEAVNSLVAEKHLKQSSKPKKAGKAIFRLALIFILVLAVIFGLSKTNLSKVFSPVSIASNIAKSGSTLKKDDGRTNILILGTDFRVTNNQGAGLTDSIMVASIGTVEKDVVLISIPRDLWVADTNGNHMKINEIFPIEGEEETQKAVSKALGIPVHYHVMINFQIFKEIIDAVGGIDVEVENTFTDTTYPIEGKENAPENERYQTVSFTKGSMHMNGETALKYSRSRHGDNGEGTDFARARRQQQVVKALKSKILSAGTLSDLSKVKAMYDTYAKNVETDIDLGALQGLFALSKDASEYQIKSLVLDNVSEAVNGGLLYAPEDRTLYAGKYVLIPKSGDYTQIHAYVSKYLFGDAK